MHIIWQLHAEYFLLSIKVCAREKLRKEISVAYAIFLNKSNIAPIELMIYYVDNKYDIATKVFDLESRKFTQFLLVPVKNIV